MSSAIEAACVWPVSRRNHMSTPQPVSQYSRDIAQLCDADVPLDSAIPPAHSMKFPADLVRFPEKLVRFPAKLGKISSKLGQISSEFGEISASSGCEFRRGWLIIFLEWALSAISPVSWGGSTCSSSLGVGFALTVF